MSRLATAGHPRTDPARTCPGLSSTAAVRGQGKTNLYQRVPGRGGAGVPQARGTKPAGEGIGEKQSRKNQGLTKQRREGG